MDSQHTYHPAPPAQPQAPVPVDQPGPFITYEPQLYSARKKRWGPVLIVLLAVVLVLAGVAGGAVWLLRGRGFLKDSGVAACEQMRDATAGGTGAADTDKKPSAAEYHAARRIFSGSRYADIRDAGTRLTDLVWQMTQVDSTSPATALALVGQLAQDYSSLAGACANHGVDLPPMTK